MPFSNACKLEKTISVDNQRQLLLCHYAVYIINVKYAMFDQNKYIHFPAQTLKKKKKKKKEQELQLKMKKDQKQYEKRKDYH